jgi:predicted alpha/beta superfamily hydrolase
MDWYEAFKNDQKQHKICGNVKIIKNFPITSLKRKRQVWVYLPHDYDTVPAKRYPVLYMNDGQNMFDPATSCSGEWYIDETLDMYAKHGIHDGAIVVAIENSALRQREYMPGMEADKYAEFMIYSLKPFIDLNFRTLPFRETTGIGGSSMGGLISLYIGLKYQSIFGKIASFSPAMGIGWNELASFSRKYSMKIYNDVGTDEVRKSKRLSKKYADNVIAANRTLKKIGFKETELKFILEPGSTHHESAWARRFGDAFVWLFDQQEINEFRNQ